MARQRGTSGNGLHGHRGDREPGHRDREGVGGNPARDARGGARAWILGAMAAAVLLVASAAWLLSTRPEPSEARATLSAVGALAGADTAGYARATGPRPFEWPEDHGPHPAFRTEWWYVTGNLATDTGRRFGLQLTFFRSAVTPEVPERASNWSTNQVWLAHAALTDVGGERHLERERIARGAAGLAGARVDPLRVWLDDWELRTVDSAAAMPAEPGTAQGIFPLELEVRTDVWAASLTLREGKPVVLQGERGWSRKGPETGNASHYYSFTRIPSEGWVEVDGRRFEVSGHTWMDREWSTSALGPDHVGWDWFSLQLSDERELMFFELRRRGGTPDPFDHGVLVEPDGTTRPLGPEDIQVEVVDTWTSPIGNVRYPSGWRLTSAEYGIDLAVRPLVRDQEMNLGFRYWEGAVSVEGRGVEGPVQGYGYVELTGYGESRAPPGR